MLALISLDITLYVSQKKDICILCNANSSLRRCMIPTYLPLAAGVSFNQPFKEKFVPLSTLLRFCLANLHHSGVSWSSLAFLMARGTNSMGSPSEAKRAVSTVAGFEASSSRESANPALPTQVLLNSLRHLAPLLSVRMSKWKYRVTHQVDSNLPLT